MATNCEYIEENVNGKQKLSKGHLSDSHTTVTSSNSSGSMNAHEEKQDGSEKATPLSHELQTNTTVPMKAECQEQRNSSCGPSNCLRYTNDNDNDSFECVFESTVEAVLDGYESDSEASGNEQVLGTELSAPSLCPERSNLPKYANLAEAAQSTVASFPRCNSFDFQSSSGSSSDNEEEPDDSDSLGIVGAIKLSSKFAKSTEGRFDVYHQRANYLLPPFIERRRLSQCKEEDDEDDADKSPQPGSNEPPKFERPSKAPPRPPTPQDEASKEKFKDLERLRQQFMHKIDRINTRNIEECNSKAALPPPPPPPPPIPATILPQALKDLLQSSTAALVPVAAAEAPIVRMAAQPEAVSPVSRAPPPAMVVTPSTPPMQQPPPTVTSHTEPLIIRGKFKVTRAQETPELRPEAQKLSKLQATANAQTISFPSSFGGYSSVQGLFSQRYGSNRFPTAAPHLSKQFFDTSLVEIRTPAISNASLHTATTNGNQSLNCDTNSLANKPKTPSERELDEIWIRRAPLAAGTAVPPIMLEATASETPPRAARPVSLGGASTMPRLLRNESATSGTSPMHPLTASGSVSVSVSEDEQDGVRVPGSRPSSAPAEPNAKAAKKAYKKMEKEQRRQEKEQSRREKEARKLERETARRIEREAAKLEKLNRHTEKISRSTERVSGTGGSSRSGSLERRRSGEDSPVLNQSTVHGIASPNRRPTIFDVFRPRAKSDAKRQKEKHLLDPSSADSSATSSTYSVSGGQTGGGGGGGGGAAAAGGSNAAGGLMNSMKVAMQNFGHRQHPAVTITNADGSVSAKSKYKDGSAHLHQGSDAQYYHTVTAVRNANQRSPMTKVMDLFRHRSNSTVSEADKRKARAAAHQQQLAVQSEYRILFIYMHTYIYMYIL